MIAANYLLLALGISGAFDVLFYHSISHGIRSHPESRLELLTHAARGPTYAVLFLVLPNFELRGAWVIALAALLMVDVGISVADFALERRSRAHFGGLPSGEYILHMIMAMFFGAFVALLAPTLGRWMNFETAIVQSDELASLWLRATLALLAVGVFCSGLMDLGAALRLRKAAIPA